MHEHSQVGDFMNFTLLYWLLFINITSFFCFYLDKRKAIKKKYRISEYSLFLLALIGGSVGSILGMYLFHHKTKKLKFKFGLPLLSFIQCLLFLILQS